jgi:hypothetical protein
MPIDIHKRLVFIHIPKTGGTSIEHMFGLTTPEHFVSPTPLMHLTPATKTPQHFTWRELQMTLPPGLLSTAFRFAFVRNPWDRFVSEYCWRRALYLRHVTTRRQHFYRARDFHNLDSFVRTLDLPAVNRLDALRGFDGHLETQRSFIVDHDETLAVDFLGRFETFAADVRTLAKTLHTDIREIVHFAQSCRDNNYHRYYSAYSRSAVATFYREDIEAFGYRF